MRKEWTPNITSLQNIFDGYKRFINDLNGALTHTVGEYRRVNETYRNDPAPEYFSSELGKKLNEKQEDTKIVFAGYSDLYLSKDQIEKQMATYLNKLENEADEYIKEINTYHEQEVNKQIEESEINTMLLYRNMIKNFFNFYIDNFYHKCKCKKFTRRLPECWQDTDNPCKY